MNTNAEISRRLRVFARPIGLHSPAMIRIANAIERHAPASVEIVSDQSSADLVILYPIGADWIPLIEEVEAQGKRFALVQCCLKSTGASCSTWAPVWDRAACVWSYLDLNRLADEEWKADWSSDRSRLPPSAFENSFYYAPLGIDDAFLSHASTPHTHSRNTVVTTGHVSGRPAEAIYEVWEAALSCGYRVTHVGPKLPSWRPGVRVRTGISDQELRQIYLEAAFVGALRYVEGFELPALEGLACGATPILFDQPDLYRWYGKGALYVPELEGQELVEELVRLFRWQNQPSILPVDSARNADILSRFSWSTLVGEFWQRILSNI